MNKIIKKIEMTFKDNFKRGKHRSRSEDKKDKIDHKYIYAEKSLEKHLSNARILGEFLEQKEIKSINKITDDVLKDFLKEISKKRGRNGKSISIKTIESYLGTINKLMRITGKYERLNGFDKKDLSDMGIDIKNAPKSVYKPFTASEWLDRNEDKANSHKEIIELIQAFGLREKEVQGLTENSFIRDSKTGLLYVQTVGKGGKFRISPTTKKMSEKMEKRYGCFAKSIKNINEYKLGKEDYIKNVSKANKIDLKGARGHNIPKHIFRSQYAQDLLKEKLEETDSSELTRKGYSHLNIYKEDLEKVSIKIGVYEGKAKAFLEVSQSLGHNRLDVLLKYLG